MKALITGGNGFVGSRMTRHMHERGWDIDTFDITDGTDVHDLFRTPTKTVYDLVVHAAYHVGGRTGIDGVNTNFPRNIALDAAMFDWAVTTKQTHVLYFSSSAVYPTRYQMRDSFKTMLRENDVDLHHPMLPDAGYGWAKLTGEHLAAHARLNGLKVSVVRPASGTHITQNADYPFPAIAQRVHAKQTPLTIWGPKGQTRDFIHIDDVCAAALAITESGTDEPVNICTGRGTTMGELAEMLWLSMHGASAGLTIEYNELAATGVYRRVLDPTRMLNYYTPKHTLETLIEEAAQAFRE